MRAGRLKDTVIIQSQPNLTDDFGEEVKTYTKVFSAKCNFRMMSADARLKAGLSLNVEVASLLMRFDSRLNYEHLILHKNNRYEVNAIIPSENGRDMVVSITRQVI